MVSTAQINDQQQYLLLSAEGVTSRNDNKRATEIAAVGRVSGNGLFHNVSAFYYKERVRWTFFVADKFKADFSLIRGLVEFHRPQSLVFNFDRKSKSVGIDIEQVELDDLQAFLSRVLDWFVQEKQFRQALRMVIEFENRSRQERNSVYAILRNTTAAMARADADTSNQLSS